MEFGESLAREHPEIQGEWGTQRAWKLCTPSHIPCPMYLFHLFKSYILL